MHRLTIGFIFLCLSIVGCAQFFAPGVDDYDGGNQLVNPGFEMDRAGWSHRDASRHWINFNVSDQVAHSGRRSAHVRVEQLADEPARRVKIAGVVQESRPKAAPLLKPTRDAWSKKVDFPPMNSIMPNRC